MEALPVNRIVEELRGEFDRAFTTTPLAQGVLTGSETCDLLAIRVGGDPYVIKVTEITALAGRRKTVPLPTPIPELIGLASIRGGLVPVYSLAMLLGYGPRSVDSKDSEPSRWLAVCGTIESLGLAFNDLEGYFRVASSDIYPASESNVAGDAIRGFIKEVANVGGLVRAVVEIPSIVEAMKRRARSRVSKER